MIIRKNWDSDFFGIEIGILDTPSPMNLSDEIEIGKNKYQLIYIFSDTELNESGLNLVDVKVVFSMDLHQSSFRNDAVKSINLLTEIEYNSLLELVYLSGHHSRFKRDSKFAINSFEKLYKEWLDNSLNRTIAFDILGYYIEDKIVGFISLETKDNKVSQIGLIAVSPKYQGRGIATNLIKAAASLSIKNNFEKITVPTQLDNINALALYSKSGFTEISRTFIYHYWTI